MHCCLRILRVLVCQTCDIHRVFDTYHDEMIKNTGADEVFEATKESLMK